MNESLTIFNNLYKIAPKITELRVLDSEEYKAFITKQGLPVALCSVRKYLNEFPLGPDVEFLYPFFQKNPRVDS